MKTFHSVYIWYWYSNTLHIFKLIQEQRILWSGWKTSSKYIQQSLHFQTRQFKKYLCNRKEVKLTIPPYWRAVSTQSLLTWTVDTWEQVSCVLLHKTSELRTANFWKDSTALYLHYLLESILSLQYINCLLLIQHVLMWVFSTRWTV